MNGDDAPEDDAEMKLRHRVASWTPAQVGKAVELAQTNPDIAHAVDVFHEVYVQSARQQAYDQAIRPVKFTPERKGILGFKSLLPSWMGGDTVNYEEVPPMQGEHPEDYRVRAEQAYAQAYDQASSQGVPILRMKHEREQSDLTMREVAGKAHNVAALPGLTALRTASGIPEVLRPSPALREFARAGEEAGAEAPAAEQVGLSLLGSFLMPSVGKLPGSSIPVKVANNPIVRGVAAGASGAGLESASQGNDLAEVMRESLHGAGWGAGMGVLGGLGGKAARLVNEGSLKRDIANLREAGGSTSLLKGFKFPGLVENALEHKMPEAAGPGGDVAANIRDPFMEQFIRERSVPKEKFDEAIRGYISRHGRVSVVPDEYAGKFYDTFTQLKTVAGAEGAVAALRKRAANIFKPINLKEGTLIPENEIGKAIRRSFRVVTIDEARDMGLPVEDLIIQRQPGEFVPDTIQEPGAMPPPSGRSTNPATGPIHLDPSAFRAVLRPIPKNAQTLQLEEKFLFDEIEKGSATYEQFKPILSGLLESRDILPSDPEFAPDSLTAKIEVDSPTGGKRTKTLTGYSALNALRHQEIEKLSHSAQRLGITRNFETDPVQAQQDMMQAILQFHAAENPDKARELLRVAQQLPGGKEALYSVPLAEKAEAMQRKASLARNVPLSLFSFKPFFRAAAIHAEPVTSKMPARVPAAAAAIGAENADRENLETLAKRLKDEAEGRIVRIPNDARLLLNEAMNYVQR